MIAVPNKEILRSIPNKRIIVTENSLIHCSPCPISNLVEGSVSGFFYGTFYFNSFLSVDLYMEGSYKRAFSEFSYTSIYDNFYISSCVVH